MEIFKEIKIEGCSSTKYYVSNTGTIKNSNGTILKAYIINSGYKTVKLYGTNRLTHRLVAEYFCPVTKDSTDVNHIDGNKLNNDASNLEWCTRSENILHAYATGLNIHSRHGLGNKKANTLFRNVTYNRRNSSNRKWLASVTCNKKRYHGGHHVLAIIAAITVNNIIIDNGLDTPLNTFTFSCTPMDGFSLHKMPQPTKVNRASHKNISFRNGKYVTGVRRKGINVKNKSFDTLEEAIAHRDNLTILHVQRLSYNRSTQ
jgi:hypothetical protein